MYEIRTNGQKNLKNPNKPNQTKQTLKNIFFSSPLVFPTQTGNFHSVPGRKGLSRNFEKDGCRGEKQKKPAEKTRKNIWSCCCGLGYFPPIYLASPGWPAMESGVGGSLSRLRNLRLWVRLEARKSTGLGGGGGKCCKQFS